MENENKTTISQAATLEEIADFWDNHSPEDYPDQVYAVEAEFDLSDELDTAVQIDPDLMQKLQRIARSRQISTQTLVNLWLQQQINMRQTELTP
ncbi:MAG TPA: CopG family antitoxin [Chloroflexota bacterium]|nr:CopG family antitoxin [Chloroflexota bacterium]HUM68676.1 CopG family antitoxin [Chloroflexota bacterium]